MTRLGGAHGGDGAGESDAHRVALGLALAAGVLGAIQPELNAALGADLGSDILASLVNFAGASTVVAAALLARPATRNRLRGIRSWAVPPWTFTAGLGGALVVVSGALAVERIGVAVFSVAFFAGQIAAGAAVDRLGLGPGGPRPVTLHRLAAVVLALAAVALAPLGRAAGEVVPGLVALSVAAGAGVACQSAFNARIAAATGDAVAATALNVAVGATAVSAIAAVDLLAGDRGPVDWPAQPWLYLGGVCGVSIVLSLAVATRALGALASTIASVAAQLVAALALDWALDGRPPSAGLVAGCVVIAGSVALVGRRRPG